MPITHVERNIRQVVERNLQVPLFSYPTLSGIYDKWLSGIPPTIVKSLIKRFNGLKKMLYLSFLYQSFAKAMQQIGVYTTRAAFWLGITIPFFGGMVDDYIGESVQDIPL